MQRVLGPKHPLALQSMNNLAQILFSQGRHAEAGAMQQQVTSPMEKVLL